MINDLLGLNDPNRLTLDEAIELTPGNTIIFTRIKTELFDDTVAKLARQGVTDGGQYQVESIVVGRENDGTPVNVVIKLQGVETQLAYSWFYRG